MRILICSLGGSRRREQRTTPGIRIELGKGRTEAPPGRPGAAGDSGNFKSTKHLGFIRRCASTVWIASQSLTCFSLALTLTETLALLHSRLWGDPEKLL